MQQLPQFTSTERNRYITSIGTHHRNTFTYAVFSPLKSKPEPKDRAGTFQKNAKENNESTQNY